MQKITASNKFLAVIAVFATLLVSANAQAVFASGGSGGGGGSGSGSGGSGGGSTTPPPAPVVATTTTTVAVFTGTTVLPTLATLGSGPFTEAMALINTGTIPLTISSVAFSSIVSGYTLSGAGAGLCSDGISLPTGTGTAASPVGANVCTFIVTYTPTAIGASIAPQVNLTFGNATAQTVAYPSTSVVSPDPTSLFSGQAVVSADTPVGGTSGAGIFTIQNTGGSDLTVNVSVDGANPQDFVRVPHVFNLRGFNTPDCDFSGNPFTLAPAITFGVVGQRCELAFAFKPTAEGPRSATLTITTNDPANPVQTVEFSGNGLPALPPPTPVAAFNFTDEWTSPVDAALVLNVIHHAKASAFTNSDAVVATIDTVDATNAPVWYVIKGGAWTSSTSYAADVKDASGAVVGSATLDFSDANNGTLSYTVSGVTTSEAIARAAF